MSFVRAVVLPAGTATLLANTRSTRRYFGVMNIGTGTAAVGGSDVTIGTGWPLAPASALGEQGGGLELTTGGHSGEIYGISTLGTTVTVIEG